MRSALALLGLAVTIVGCGKAADPLEGKWDVTIPEDAASGHIMVGEFRDGKVTFDRRGDVMGIGRVDLTTSGVYEVNGNEVALTRKDSKIDASAITDPKIRAATIKVMQSMAQQTEGRRMVYSMKVESPTRIILSDPSGSITLNRAR